MRTAEGERAINTKQKMNVEVNQITKQKNSQNKTFCSCAKNLATTKCLLLLRMKHTSTAITSCHGDIWTEGVGVARAEVKLNDVCRVALKAEVCPESPAVAPARLLLLAAAEILQLNAVPCRRVCS